MTWLNSENPSKYTAPEDLRSVFAFQCTMVGQDNGLENAAGRLDLVRTMVAGVLDYENLG